MGLKQLVMRFFRCRSSDYSLEQVSPPRELEGGREGVEQDGGKLVRMDKTQELPASGCHSFTPGIL